MCLERCTVHSLSFNFNGNVETEGFVISVYFPSVQQVYDQTENETCLHDLFWHYIIIILISPV